MSLLTTFDRPKRILIPNINRAWWSKCWSKAYEGNIGILKFNKIFAFICIRERFEQSSCECNKGVSATSVLTTALLALDGFILLLEWILKLRMLWLRALFRETLFISFLMSSSIVVIWLGKTWRLNICNFIRSMWISKNDVHTTDWVNDSR